jgi:hypothetical protein
MAVEGKYNSFVKDILQPKLCSTLKDAYKSMTLTIQVFRDAKNASPTEVFEIDNLYPFQTVADLCARIYMESGMNDEFHPENQCLLKRYTQDKKPRYLIHMQYYIGKNIPLYNPYRLIESGKSDSAFVDTAGDSTMIPILSFMNKTLESTIFYSKKTHYDLELYLYSDLYRHYTGAKPVSRTIWEGVFKAYFPERVKENEGGSLTPAAESYKKTLAKRHTCKQQTLELIDSHLQETPLRKPGESSRADDMNLSSMRNIRFLWPAPINTPIYKPFQIETVFYETPVSKNIPYMRFYPRAATPLSKLFVEGPEDVPIFEFPDLLLQWSQYKTITPEESLIMLKVLVRPQSGSSNPLFATMYIHEDGSAKFIVQPDANSKSLTEAADLYDLGNVLEKLSATIPLLEPANPDGKAKQLYTANNIQLEDAYIILSLWLDKEDTNPITKKSIQRVLPFYRPLFQITSSPLRFQNPIAFIRYKAVDNFQTPSKDYQFLHRVIDLQKLSGKTSLADLVKFYMEEFDVPLQTAQARVKSFLDDMKQYEVVDPTVTDYKETKNPGIDVAIFGKHPFYTFHIYRVNSLITLRRIYSMLALLISLGPGEFGEIEHCYATAQEEEREEEKVAEEESASKHEELADFEDTLGEFELEADAPAEGEAQTVAVPAAEPSVALEKLASVEEEDPPEQVALDLKKAKAKTYFSQRLDYYDKKLFQYSEGDTDATKYSSMCAANAMKQPAVMNEGEYLRMRDMYEENTYTTKEAYEALSPEEKQNISVFWIDYPLEKGKKYVEPPSIPGIEVITTIKYGSNMSKGQANVYMCSQLWCRKDSVVVLKKDYDATRDRKGNGKDKNTCPFCHEGPVKNRVSLVEGESVIERAPKMKSAENKAHLFVSFLKKTNHPAGLYLPCCFLKDSKQLKTGSHPAFKGGEEEEEEEDAGVEEVSADYKKKLENSKSWYIVGAEKVPLEIVPKGGPQVGILSKQVDTFFAQDSRDLVVNDHTIWKLVSRGDKGKEKASASGFLRIAVENRKRFQANSFLAAIAPAFGKNSADEMKTQIRTIVQAPLFISLNYGNFIFDFFNPSMVDPPEMEIRKFSNKVLALESGVGTHREALTRVWKSYQKFGQFMENSTQVKEYRQFAQLLSLPTLMSQNGILFIILEIGQKGDVQLRCPPYGVTDQMLNKCDVAFLLHYSTNVWEPIIYTENNIEEGIHRSYVVFKREEQDRWPAIVQERLLEYKKMCHSSGIGIYTDSPKINPYTLIPLSTAMRIGDTPPYAVLRDTYNHISGVLFKLETGGIVLVPVIDDGTIHPGLKVELDWRNFMGRLASATAAKEFYDTKVAVVLAEQRPEVKAAYEIDGIWRLDKSVPDRKEMFGLHFVNGIIVPVRQPESGETILESSEVQEGQESNWCIDTRLVFGTICKAKEDGAKKVADDSLEMNHMELEEIYEHLRFTFANWLSTEPASMREQINSILYRATLPLFEKRQRLFIKLGNEVMSWLDSSVPHPRRKPTFKRTDCRLIKDKGSCNNYCSWRETDGKCFLHVPTSPGDVKGLMLRRLIEELIRFPKKRAEILANKIRKYTKLTKAFRSGNQYIVPESSDDWVEFLRAEWRLQSSEQPRHFEEFGAVQPQEDLPFTKGEMPGLFAGVFQKKGRFAYFSTESAVETLVALSRGTITAQELVERGQQEDIPTLVTQELVDLVARRLKTSVLQITYIQEDPAQPIVLSRAIDIGGMLAPFLVIVQDDQGEVGFISASQTTIAPLPKKLLPAEIQKYVS